MQILTPGLHQIYRFCLRFRGPQSEDKVTDKVTNKVTALTEPFFFVHDVHDVGNKNRSIGNMNSWQICGRDKNIESSNKSRRKIISTLASRYIALKVKNVFFLYPEQSRFITRCCFVWPLKMRWSEALLFKISSELCSLQDILQGKPVYKARKYEFKQKNRYTLL